MSFKYVVDDRLVSNDAHEAVDLKRGTSVNLTSVTPIGDGASNASTVDITIPPCTASGRQVPLDVQVDFVITLTGTNLSTANGAVFTPNLRSGGLGFKAWPFNRVIGMMTHEIGNIKDAIPTYQFIDVLSRTISEDMTDEYNNLTFDVFDNYFSAGFAGSNSPLADAGLSPMNKFNKSRRVGINSITSTAATNLVISGTIYEPLITPFTMGDNRDRVIWNISRETLSWTYSNRADMIALNPSLLGTAADAATVTGIAVAFNNLKVYMQYVNPIKAIEDVETYLFPKYIVQSSPFTAGAEQTFTCSAVPNLLYTGVRSSPNDRGTAPNGAASQADKFYNVTQAQIRLGNNAALLNQASQHQLYLLSKANGYKGTYEMWSAQVYNGTTSVEIAGAAANSPLPRGSGSLLILSPTFDLNANNYDLVDNEDASVNVSINLTAVNQSGVSQYVPTVANPQLFLITQYYQRLVRNGNTFELESITVSPSDARKFLDMKNFDGHVERSASMSGGNIFSSIWHGIKKAGKWLWKNRDGVADAVKSVAKLAGAGIEQKKQPTKSKPGLKYK